MGMEYVLLEIFRRPTKVKSDISRRYALEIAALASQGFVSTLEGSREYGSIWRITGTGLDYLRCCEVLGE